MKVLNDRTAPNACDGCSCHGRREFLYYGAAAIAAAALAACGLSSAPTAPDSIQSTTLQLSSFPQLNSIGGVATLSVSGSPIAIVRESSSTFSAFSLICPHQGNTVQKASNGFYCPGHGAQFDIQGNWTGGQRTSNLHSYPVAYDATAGTLTVG